MNITLSTASTIKVGDWIMSEGVLSQVTSIMDTPASDVEGASRVIRHTEGMMCIYASEPVGIPSY